MANAVVLYKRISVQNTHTQAVGRHWNLSLMTCINSLCCLCHCRPHWDQALLRTGIHCRNKSSTQLLHWAFQACFNRKHFYTPTRHKLLAYVKNFSHLLVGFFLLRFNRIYKFLHWNQPTKKIDIISAFLQIFFFLKLCAFVKTKYLRVKLGLNFLQKTWNTRKIRIDEE